MAFVNQFTSVHVPVLFAWQLWMHGITIDYWPDRNQSQSQAISGVWKEGAEGETLSPGRYSIFWIPTDAVAAKPKRGDAVQKDGFVYDVVDVKTTATGHSRLTLQENFDG